ncbi:MAG: hypothetical protein M1548_01935 [Actinobacteria bacterium]|nr:hypothetical protein [Actinomycetota bacterium]
MSIEDISVKPTPVKIDKPRTLLYNMQSFAYMDEFAPDTLTDPMREKAAKALLGARHDAIKAAKTSKERVKLQNLPQEFADWQLLLMAAGQQSMKAGLAVICAGLMHEEETLTPRQVGSMIKTFADYGRIFGLADEAIRKSQVKETDSAEEAEEDPKNLSDPAES